MVFSSLTFLFIFFPMTIFVYFVSKKPYKNLVLFIASLVFYFWCEPIYVYILLFIIVFNYSFAFLIKKFKHDKLRKNIVFYSMLVVNVFTVLSFKYQMNLLMPTPEATRIGSNLLSLLPPIGISIFVLQAISYVIDLYLNKIKIQRNFLNFALYISFFPNMICGPIVRYSDIKNELEEREETTNKFSKGFGMFVRGLAKKVFLADSMITLWHVVSSMDFEKISTITAWLGVIAYTFAIYFYFSGYSDMARGIGKMFGFEIPINFNYPYVSKSIVEFWRRWNISLTVFFKSYVFTPLWKNNNSLLVNMIKLLGIWILMSLWYGGEVTYLLWGVYMGVIIILEKLFMSTLLEKIPKFFQRLYTIFLILIGFAIFSAGSIENITPIFHALFMQNNVEFIDSTALFIIQNNYLWYIIAIVCCTNFYHNFELKYEHNKPQFALWFKNILEIVLFVVSIIFCIANQGNGIDFFLHF